MKTLKLREKARQVVKQVTAAEDPLDADLSELEPMVKNPFVVSPEPDATDIAQTVAPTTRNPNLEELTYLRGRVEFFRDFLRGMFYRSQEEIEIEIQQHVDKIMSVAYPNLVYGFIDQYYTYDWWRNEPDTNFKQQLAPALLRACRQRVPGFSNRILESIVDGDPETSYIMGSFVEE